MSRRALVLAAVLGCAALVAASPGAHLSLREEDSSSSTDSPPTSTTGSGPTNTAESTSTPISTTGPCSEYELQQNQTKCISCSQYCEGDNPSPQSCPDSKACLQDGDSGVCLSVELTSCNTCTSSDFTTCDAFNPQVVDACIPDKAPEFYKNCTEGEVCEKGVCVKSSLTTLAPGSGQSPSESCEKATDGDSTVAIIPIKPECTTGLLCSGSDVVNEINCTEGEYFDPTAVTCLSLPINHCEERPDGPAPYQTNCSKWVVCQNGAVVIELDCNEGQLFDIESNSCVDESDGPTCTELDGCTFDGESSSGGSDGSTSSTAAPSGGTMPEQCTASNLNQRYPVEGDCTSYWTCRKVSGSTYSYVKSKCTGTLVFNPQTTYCDLPANVPGCN